MGWLRKVWIYLGMVRSWHLGRQGNAGVGVDRMGVELASEKRCHMVDAEKL